MDEDEEIAAVEEEGIADEVEEAGGVQEEGVPWAL